MIKIYHNNQCSKSQCALELLTESLAKLQMKPEDLVRKGEKLYQEQFAGKTFSDAEWIEILVANPILIERPIVVTDKGAAIGRPIENILKIM